ncbi:TadE family protein [Brachybacterium alimentarium]|uniref:TadE family protein n=1 Tax=Brachybacterium alimentarium TaxID=47845 RepID=UPI003FD65C1D
MAEFPMVAVLIILIALAVVQAALVLHTRNTLIDAAVQGAHHASLVGAAPDDGAARAEQLVQQRFGSSYQVAATASEDADSTITVHVRATLPLVGLFGPAGTLRVEGRALDEEAW